jgi:hypothetical protein
MELRLGRGATGYGRLARVGKRKARSDSERLELSKHLLYEIEMFAGTVRMLNVVHDMEASEARTILRNALLESWALHLRNLLSFLYDTRAGAGDAIALDFLGGGWKEKRGPKGDVLRMAHAKASKEMAHLSYLRAELRDDQREWHIEPIICEGGEALHSFVDAVPEALVTDDFRERAWAVLPVRPISFSDHALQIVAGATASLDAFRPR